SPEPVEEPYSGPELPVEEELDPEPLPVEEPSEPEPAEEEAPKIIIVNAPSRQTYELDAKPAHDDFADSLSGSLTVILSDGTVTDVSVEWHCDDYSSDYGRFTFAPTVVGSEYALDGDVELPTVALYIRYISDVSMKGKYAPVVAKKPASSAEGVAKKLKWPTEVKATLVGKDETTVKLPVVWECDDYSRYDSGEFTFTAAFAPEVDYITGRKLKMPAITLRVISDKQFTLDINSDNEIIITGLRNDRTEAIEIPAKIEGLKVVEIDDKAFKDCSNLMMVTVSNGIEKIGDKAFAGCSELIAVELPDSLRSVDKDAFDKKVLKTLAIVLNVYGDDTRLTDEDTFKHDGKSVHLPADIDSIVVKDDAELTIDTDFTVESDSLTGLTVERYGKVTLRKGEKLINNGIITVDGEF
ncbi:MAG: leucine-rich repeat protein, partial [bacterium]